MLRGMSLPDTADEARGSAADRPESVEQARRNYAEARDRLLLFLDPVDDGGNIGHNTAEWAAPLLSAKVALLQLTTLEWAMLETRDLKQAVAEYVVGAKENAAASMRNLESANRIAGSVRKATWVAAVSTSIAALATAGTLAVAIMQWKHPAPAPVVSPVINVPAQPAPVVNVAAPTINLPPQPPVRRK